jgi:hypothetical protein
MPPRAIRLHEEINGRQYRIEVAPTATGKWRAQVLKAHGGPSALMPFYGPTPESAAGQLSAWLTRVHRRSTDPA